MKQDLRVAFIDFWPEFEKDENFFSPILETHFNIIKDLKNPDVVFFSVFGNSNIDKYKNALKILFIAENILNPIYSIAIKYRISAAYNKADYTISFDKHSDINYRLPLWQVFILNKPEYWDKLTNRVNHSRFKNFCSFTVSNDSNFIRNGMFSQLSSYKQVNSYGRYLTNNNALQIASQGRYWRDAKDDFFEKNTHKFSIAFENNSAPYYCTEKLMDSFLSGSMPIYWGDPKVKEDWNGAAFLNYNDYQSSVIQVIKKMDTDYEIFESKYHAPVFLETQKQKHIENIEGFKEWLINKMK